MNSGEIVFYFFAAAIQWPCVHFGSKFRVAVFRHNPEVTEDEVEREILLSREILGALVVVSFGSVLLLNLNFGGVLIVAVVMGALGPIALQPSFDWFNRIFQRRE